MVDQRKPLALHLPPLMQHLNQRQPQVAVRLNKLGLFQPERLLALPNTYHSLLQYVQKERGFHFEGSLQNTYQTEFFAESHRNHCVFHQAISRQ